MAGKKTKNISFITIANHFPTIFFYLEDTFFHVQWLIQLSYAQKCCALYYYKALNKFTSYVLICNMY